MNENANILPQAIDLEETVLGAIMLERGVIDEVSVILTPEDFYKDTNRLIYKAILELDHNNEPIDILTVTEQLRKCKKLDEVNGPLYITSLTGKVATADNIIGHAHIIKAKSVQRKMIEFANSLCKFAYNPNDIEDLISMANKQIGEITEDAYGQTKSTSFRGLLSNSLKQAEQRETLSKKGGVAGIRTPLADLNKVTGGFQAGELIIVAGRPSMGKTAVALAIAKTAAIEKNHVLMFSLEMKGERLTDRLLCGEADIDPEKFRNGGLTSGEWSKLEKSLGKLEDLGIHILDDPMVNIDNIRARSRIMKRKNQCDLIIIDYLQLIDNKSKNRWNREQEVAEISRQTKLLAMELDVPVIIISQLNRSCEVRANKKPILADLRESGAIEQDADLVCLIFRAEQYMDENHPEIDTVRGLAELIIAKNRNGRTGIIEFKVNKSLTRIFDKGASYETETSPPKDYKSEQYDSDL